MFRRLRILSPLSTRAHPTSKTLAAWHAPRLPSQAHRLSPSVFRYHHNSSSQPKLCPACSSPLATALPVCTKCSYIAPIPDSMTFHEMLGVSYEPNPFIIDVAALKNQFRAVQAVVHPDRWVAKPPDQRAIAAAMSSRVNEALHRLSSPLRRAEYILAQEGLPGEETYKLDDMDLLLEVMEAREGLANAQSANEVEEIRAENDVRIRDTIQEIEEVAGAKDWEKLRVAAVKLKYLQGIEAAAATWPDVVHDH